MSHAALIDGDRHAIATFLILLLERGLDDIEAAESLSSLDAIEALGHQVTRADLIGLARFVSSWCGDLGIHARLVQGVIGRFADDDQAAAILPLDLAALVGVLRPIFGATTTGCAAA